MPWSAPGTSACAASRYGPGYRAFAWRGFLPRCSEHERWVGKGAKRRAHHAFPSLQLDGGHAALCPPYGCVLRCMTFDDIRKLALLWPEVEDGTSYGTPALKVRKKMLARLKE